jgi:serine/threonine protein kinase
MQTGQLSSGSFRQNSLLAPELSFGSKGSLFSNKGSGQNESHWLKSFRRVLKYWPEFLIFCLAVAASVVCFWLLRASEDSSADDVFVQQASDRATVLVWEMNRVLGDLEIVTAFMSVSLDWREDFFREKFKNLTIGILDRSPGTQGLTWVPMVTDPADRVFLEEQQGRQLNLSGSPLQMRSTFSGHTVRCIYLRNAAGSNLCSPSIPKGGPFRAGGPQAFGDHAFFPVYFLEPVNDPTKFRSSNEAAIMFDLSSNSARNQSISTAIIKNSPSATSRLLLVQERESQYGLIVFSPVYQSLPCIDAKGQGPKCRTLIGLTNAVFRITDLVIKSQKGLVAVDTNIRGDQFLLDLGNKISSTGHVPLQFFLPGNGCDEHANYSLKFGVDELYSNLNASASDQTVKARLSAILPAICRAVQGDPTLSQKLVNFKDHGLSFSGLDSEGAFYINSFMVADRRWMFIVHSQQYYYRHLLSTNAPPIILAVGILLASILMGGSFLFRKLQHQIAQNAFLVAFRNAATGDKATALNLPALLSKDYIAVEIISKRKNVCVVQSTRKQSGESVAIKLVVNENGKFDETEKDQLKREAFIMKAFTENACDFAVHLAGIGAFRLPEAGTCWFIMEFVQGVNMELVVNDHVQGPIDDMECIKLARQMLSALKLMHTVGILHRDVCLSNIIRCKGNKTDRAWDGRSYTYKLLDFGSAAGIDAGLAPEAMMISASELVQGAGSLPYRSPEMFRTPETASYPTDLWSLGVSMFAAVTGRRPFEEDGELHLNVVIADLLCRSPNVLDSLSAEERSKFDNNLAKVIAKALEKDVTDRYQTVDEMYNALYTCLIKRGEATYSVFLSYRVASEAPLAQLIFDELNHTITPGGHRVTIYFDAHRLVKGENWEDGFIQGILNSLCMFPLMSYGSTAPLAELPEERLSQLLALGWEANPVGRKRLFGKDSDDEDNILKEWLIAVSLLERRVELDSTKVAKNDKERGVLQSAYPILVGRQHPQGHTNYPRMGNYFHVHGGGGRFSQQPSGATNQAAARALRDKAHLPKEHVQRAEARGVASVVQSLTALQGCQLWNHPRDLAEAGLSDNQRCLMGMGCAGPPVDLEGAALTTEQQRLCSQGLDERQLRMLKAQVRYYLPHFHEIIDRAVAAHESVSAMAASGCTPQQQQASLVDEMEAGGNGVGDRCAGIVVEAGGPRAAYLNLTSLQRVPDPPASDADPSVTATLSF